MTKLVPQLMTKLYERVIKDIKKDGFMEGLTYPSLKVPTYVYQIPPTELAKIFHGHDSIGGTIDYFYIGPASVEGRVPGRFNGKFISVKDFAAQKKFYFRLRVRDVIQNKITMDFTKKTKEGYPALYVTGPSRTNAARFVIDDAPPAGAVKRRL